MKRALRPKLGSLGLPDGFHSPFRPTTRKLKDSWDSYSSDSFSCPTASFLMERNQHESIKYCEEPAFSRRVRYLAQHPTQIACFKCMDGRLDLSVFCNLPAGIITPFRNIAGRFDLGWPLLKEAVNSMSGYALKRGQQTVALCCYHYSVGDTCRGCAGNNFDLCLSKSVARQLYEQFEGVFGKDGNGAVVPLMIGMETDEDSLVFHGSSDDSAPTLSIASLVANNNATDADVAHAMKTLYPQLSGRLLNDIIPLAQGNATHVSKVKQSNRPIVEMNHMETIIAVGRGFDWLHLPNKALIIGPFEHNWTDSVVTAAKIVQGNIEHKRVNSEEGIVLLASSLSWQPRGSYGWKLSEGSAVSLARATAEAIHANPVSSNLLNMAKVHVLPGVVEGTTMRMWPIHCDDQ
eukprot:PhF_6_TR30549/c1_g1_i1/m.44839